MALDSMNGHVYVYITFEFQVFFFFYSYFFSFLLYVCHVLQPSDARCQGLSMCVSSCRYSSLSDVEGKERSIIFYFGHLRVEPSMFAKADQLQINHESMPRRDKSY